MQIIKSSFHSRITNLLMVFTALFSSACEDLLSLQSQTTISPESVFSTANGTRSALISCYSSEVGWASYMATMVPDVYGNPDISVGGANPTLIALSYGIVTPTTDLINEAWQSIWVTFYRSISYCNFLIENETKFRNINEPEKSTMLAEAKFSGQKLIIYLYSFLETFLFSQKLLIVSKTIVSQSGSQLMRYISKS